MIPEKAKKIMYGFLVIYLIFGIILVYLFAFNSGLEIKEDFNRENNTKVVYIHNTTTRTINNVELKYKSGEIEQEFDLMKIEQLYPNQEVEISFQGIEDLEVDLIAKAPFHLTVEKKIILQGVKNKEDLTIALDAPSNARFGESFEFNLEICNTADTEKQAKIEEKHETTFFSEPNKTSTTTLEPGECKKTDFELLPIEKGITTIYFKINISNTIKEIEHRISVD